MHLLELLPATFQSILLQAQFHSVLSISIYVILFSLNCFNFLIQSIYFCPLLIYNCIIVSFAKGSRLLLKFNLLFEINKQNIKYLKFSSILSEKINNVKKYKCKVINIILDSTDGIRNFKFQR